ncbi:MAG TPA: hypothetical protein VI685_02095 [Candidatus Angelobacter sp.]
MSASQITAHKRQPATPNVLQQLRRGSNKRKQISLRIRFPSHKFMSDYRTEFDNYYEKAMDLLQSNGSTQAYEYINAIEDNDYRDGTFDRMAQFLAARGDLAEALRYSAAIRGTIQHADTLFEVGRALIKNGSSDEAKDIFRQAVEGAQTIECPYERAAVLAQISDTLFTLGSKNEALSLLRLAVELAKPLPQDFEAGKTLRGCARILASWNRLQEAIDVASTIDDHWSGLRKAALEEIHGGGQWPVHPRAEGGAT